MVAVRNHAVHLVGMKGDSQLSVSFADLTFRRGPCNAQNLQHDCQSARPGFVVNRIEPSTYTALHASQKR